MGACNGWENLACCCTKLNCSLKGYFFNLILKGRREMKPFSLRRGVGLVAFDERLCWVKSIVKGITWHKCIKHYFWAAHQVWVSFPLFQTCSYHGAVSWHTSLTNQRSAHHSGQICPPLPTSGPPLTDTQQNISFHLSEDLLDRWSPVSLEKFWKRSVFN